jgi:tetratricopeptide (TPR) repeat protein
MSKNGTTDTKAHAEQLMREAVSLFEQGRLEEALLACEGALALDETYAPALSLKGLIHERRGQVAEAMAAYERVQAVNPLSVAERARLDALRRQARAVVRPAPARPLWVETLPVALAFLGVGLVSADWLRAGLALERAACARAKSTRSALRLRAFPHLPARRPAQQSLRRPPRRPRPTRRRQSCPL